MEKIIRYHGLKGPASLLGLSNNEMIEILGLSEFVAYKMTQRIKTIAVLLSLLNDLESNGINVTTKYESNYPQCLAKSMKKRAPIFLYYAGDLASYTTGISLSGLSELSNKDNAYTKRIVDKIIEEEKYYLSNGTKGVNNVAYYYALNHGCKTIEVVCDNMIETVRENRRYIKNNQLVVISAVDPHSKFNVTNAIDRNSYVCGLSKYQIIVSSKINNGATWFTCLQNLHHGWTEQLVLDNDYLGNQRLLEMQATPLYIKDVLSDFSFDIIYETNQTKKEIAEVNIDQMSMFEFIGEENDV